MMKLVNIKVVLTVQNGRHKENHTIEFDKSTHHKLAFEQNMEIGDISQLHDFTNNYDHTGLTTIKIEAICKKTARKFHQAGGKKLVKATK